MFIEVVPNGRSAPRKALEPVETIPYDLSPRMIGPAHGCSTLWYSEK
ncbi:MULTISPECIES: hypothetical protein [Acidiphilium]|nr:MULTISPECIES: hypothetical protein [Acidiphilium]